MAIIKVVKKSGKTHVAVNSVLKYVGKKAYETFGINCNVDYKKVANEFLETKKYFDKLDGRQYRHYIQSFAPGEVTKDKILEIAKEWAEKSFRGHEVFIALHDDRKHLHAHFIVNSVNFENGIKLHTNKKDLEHKKELNLEICKKHGIDFKKTHREVGDVKTYDKNKYQIIKKGGADITNLAESIMKNMKTATSKEEFILAMKEDKYSVEWNENKKNIVFTAAPEILKGKRNKFRLSNLEKAFNIPDFTKGRLLKIFEENKEKSLKTDETIFKKSTVISSPNLNNSIKNNKANLGNVKEGGNGIKIATDEDVWIKRTRKELDFGL